MLVQPLLSGTQTNFLWRIRDGAVSKECRRPWKKGWPGFYLALVSSFLGTLFSRMTWLFATNFPGP